MAKFYKGGATEGEGRDDGIDDEMVVEEWVAGDLSKLFGDGQLAGGGYSVDKDQSHGVWTIYQPLSGSPGVFADARISELALERVGEGLVEGFANVSAGVLDAEEGGEGAGDVVGVDPATDLA